ncbi:hypothetical protein I5262_10990 [Neisseria gonorrhoeae]|nr:hypothetical protein [Neisseria gonorrhoeae]MCH8692837.1 hypothetical protein [Neisseria gonorrhoeae]MCH8696854.1 hypothetical protein [Neisseria gonorrhoeae]MCH8698748.1 hypothetical protein [Neisseria gonorrhoeae]MCH8737217.1 hypothetical protein [Neisseria gonorrhoeae]MCH8804412.1 hypothetical protein [Neisseria gonorrhoeae]
MPSEAEKKAFRRHFCLQLKRSRSKSRHIGIIIGCVQPREFGVDARTPM